MEKRFLGGDGGGGGGGESEVTSTGVAALWVGFASMVLFTTLFVRASYHSRSKTSRIYHYITTVITLICGSTYLFMALMVQDYVPWGSTSFIWVHYADWVVATPLLLVDLGMLAGMKIPEVAFLCVCDVLMIGSGYAGAIATDNRAAWPMFALGCVMFIAIVASLVAHLVALSKAHANSAESKAFYFLALWTIGFWMVYPVLFVLTRLHLLTLDAEAIVYCVLDILAKGVFGAILVGSREALEGEHTALALMAMAATGITPSLRRKESLDLTYMQELEDIARRASIVPTAMGAIMANKAQRKPKSASGKAARADRPSVNFKRGGDDDNDTSDVVVAVHDYQYTASSDVESDGESADQTHGLGLGHVPKRKSSLRWARASHEDASPRPTAVVAAPAPAAAAGAPVDIASLLVGLGNALRDPAAAAGLAALLSAASGAAPAAAASPAAPQPQVQVVGAAAPTQAEGVLPGTPTSPGGTRRTANGTSLRSLAAGGVPMTAAQLLAVTGSPARV